MTSAREELIRLLAQSQENPAAGKARKLPLAYQQERLWFIHNYQEQQQRAYNIPLSFRLRGAFDVQAWERALARVVGRHEILRTSFQPPQGEQVSPVQAVAPDVAAKVRLLEVGEGDVVRQVRDLSGHVFDLNQAPLFRMTVLRVAPDHHVVHLVMHHIISDGWSIGIMAREMLDGYAVETGRKPATTTLLEIQYGDYALWQQRQDMDAHVAYWRERLAGYEDGMDLPYRVPTGGKREGKAERLRLKLPAETGQQLAGFGQAQRASLFMVLLTALAVVLHKYTGRTDLCLGTTVAGRNQFNLEPLIGFFVNIVPLRIDISGNPDAREMLARIRQALIGALEHQDLPFEQLLTALAIERSRDRAPLVPIMVRHQNYPEASFQGVAQALGLEMETVAERDRDAKCDLDIQFYGDASNLEVVFEYASDLFFASTIQRMLAHFQQALEEILQEPGRALSSFGSITQAEERLFAQWNSGAGTDTPAAQASPGVVRLFEQQVTRTPHAMACIDRRGETTFEQLDQKSTQVANLLRSKQLHGARVAVLAHRSSHLLTAFLGILKARCIYVPVEASYPQLYVAAILKEADPDLILTTSDQEDGPALADWPRTAIHCVDSETVLSQPCTGASEAAHPSQVAYIAFTSGSTGRPKGVVVPHAQILNWLHALWRRSPIEPGEVIAQKTPASFVVSIKELLAGLLAGAPALFLDDATAKDPVAFANALEKWKVTRLNLVPSHLQALLDAVADDPARLRHLKTCTTAGEPLTTALANRVTTDFPALRLWNNYGCTELNDITYFFVEGRQEGPFVPSGSPISHTRLHVLNEQLQRVPVGVAGELCVDSAGISLGYWRQPAATADRYVPDPFGVAGGARLYRTGDIVRWRDDGTIEFLGRKDFEVKVRGNRVDVRQVEVALTNHPVIRQVAVKAWKSGEGSHELAAYYVGDEQLPVADLRRYLADRVPSFMVPAHYVRLAELPKLPNGKLARNALARPVEAAPAETDADAIPPNEAVEAALAGIWCSVLGRSAVGRHDDFFAIGGHSLLATQVIRHVRERMAVDIPLPDLFEYSTLKDFAARVEHRLDHGARAGGQAPVLAVVPDMANRHEPFPLTDIQQAYLMGRQKIFTLGGVATHGYQEIAFKHLDLARLARVLNRIIARHDMLRVVFNEDLTQKILERVPRYEIQILDLRGQSREAAQAVLASRRQEMSHQVLDPSRWPVFDIRATLLDEETTHVHVSTDALLMDSASARLLARDIARLYADENTVLPDLQFSFRDYAIAMHAMQGSPRHLQAQAYWKARLAQLPSSPELALAVDPASIANPAFVRRAGELPVQQWARLQERASRLGVTRSVLLLSAYAQVLAAWSKTPRFTINLTTFSRVPLHPDVDHLVGDFTSLLLLEVDASPSLSFEQRTRAIQRQLWRDMEHSEVTGVQILRELSQQKGERQTIMPVVFTSTLTEKAVSGEARNNPFTARSVQGISQTPQTWIDHQVTERDGQLVFRWDVVESLFPPGLIDSMFDAYCRFLDAMADGPIDQQPSCSLVPALVEQVAQAANNTAGKVPTALLHELFDERAEKSPRAPAVFAADVVLSYADLRDRARTLGLALREQGVAPGELVAVVMDKGWEQVVAVLGILYAGGAYLPLDAALPQPRLAQLLEQAGVAVAVVAAAGRAAPRWPTAVRTVVVDERLKGRGHELKALAGTPQQLAYVIYTSGSTGTPKGVMIDHRGAVNTVEDVNERFHVSASDRILGLSSLTFDLSVYDIFGTLAAGAALVLPDADASRDAVHWLRLVERHQVTLWNSVPALAALFLDAVDAGATVPSLRLFLLSGDTVAADLPDRLWRIAPDANVVSLGGATEASIWSIGYPVSQAQAGLRSIPYGKALRNQQMHVLDDALRQRPFWVAGKIYIGGMGLAKGYLGDAEKTGAVFITTSHGERLYCTGDLGRLLPDGNIEFLGREDTQVKVAGYRIELGEVESALCIAPGVRAGAVRVIGDQPSSRRLVAYVVVAQGAPADGAALTRELRTYLRGVLPHYMVPTQVVVLDRMPLTANGKIDRVGLPEPAMPARRAGANSPATPLELEIAAFWKDVLQIDSASSDDDFFELGGNSISATRVVSRIRKELGIDIGLAVPFESPVLRDFAARVALVRDAAREEGASAHAMPSAGRDSEKFPLSHSQERIWCLDRFEPERGFYNVSSAIRLGGRLDLPALERALREITRRHDILRSVIVAEADSVQQAVRPAVGLQPRQSILAGVTPDEHTARAMALLDEEAKAPFNCQESLVRAHLVRINGVDEFVQITAHHVICDGWSVGLLLQEIGKLYRHYSSGTPVAPAVPPAMQYRDYVAAQRDGMRSPRLLAQRDYWTGRLSGAPYGIDLPLDHPRPARHICHSAVCSRRLDPARIAQAKAMAQANGATLFMVLLSALGAQLHHWTGADDFVIGTVVAGRVREEVEAMVGCFINFLPLRLRVDGAQTGRSLLGSVSRTVLEAYENQEYPFMKMADALAEGSGAKRMPLFNVAFQMVNLPRMTAVDALGSRVISLNREATALDLRFVLSEDREGGIGVDCGYNTDLFERATIAALLEAYEGTLVRLVSGLDSRLNAGDVGP